MLLRFLAVAAAVVHWATVAPAAPPAAGPPATLLALVPTQNAELCQAMGDAWQAGGGRAEDMECLALPGDEVEPRVREAYESGRYGYLAEVLRRANGWYSMRGESWSRGAGTTGRTGRWELREDPDRPLEDLLRRGLAQLLAEGRGEVSGVPDSWLHRFSISDRLRLSFSGQIEALDRLGQPLDLDDAADLLAQEDAEVRNAVRTAAVLGGTMGLFTLTYQLTGDIQDEDWDYQWDPKTRFATEDHWKLDTNNRWLNWGHTLTGVVYHQIPRSNGYGFWGSYAVNAFASSWWEMVAEYKEVISINDQVQTIVGGSVTGESLYLIGDLLDTTRPSFGTRLVGTLIRPFDPLNRWLDDKDWLAVTASRPRLLPGRQRLDDFHFSWLLRNVRPEGEGDETLGVFGLHGEVMRPRVESPGRLGQLFWQPALTRLDLEAELGTGSSYLEGVHFDNRLALMGVQLKDIRRDGAGLHGYSLFLGPLQGVEWRNREYEPDDDWYGIINTVGGTLDGVFHLGGDRLLRLGADLTGDFAMIQPYALSQFERNHSLRRGKLVLRQERYVYAWGPSVRARADARWGRRARLGAEWRESTYDSIDRLKWERFPNSVKDDTNTEDVIRSWEVTAAVCLSRACDPSRFRYSGSSIWELELGYESLFRRGEMHRSSDPSQRAGDSRREHRFHLGLNAKY